MFYTRSLIKMLHMKINNTGMPQLNSPQTMFHSQCDARRRDEGLTRIVHSMLYLVGRVYQNCIFLFLFCVHRHVELETIRDV